LTSLQIRVALYMYTVCTGGLAIVRTHATVLLTCLPWLASFVSYVQTVAVLNAIASVVFDPAVDCFPDVAGVHDRCWSPCYCYHLCLSWRHFFRRYPYIM
jgi:hypothetical protein